MNTPAIPVFDGHNDTLLRLEMARAAGKPISFMNGDDSLHIDLPKAKQGLLAGGLFAMFVPPKQEPGQTLKFEDMQRPIDQAHALKETLAMVSCAYRLERESEGAVRICRSSSELDMALQDNVVALMLHIEGAEAIDANFDALEVLYAAGLRSIGPVWSRNNIFAHGVPFDFPGSPDQGPGLTDLGREFVRRCNKMHILIDMSHLNEAGFWDIAKLSTDPLVATHSNVHALSPSPRNLTDRQLDAIAESQGVVGLNYAVGFLRDDGQKYETDTPISLMLAHLDHLLTKLGEEGVALGSDFDGATVPAGIGSAAGNPILIQAMLDHGYGEALVKKIAYQNWLSLLKRTGI